MKKRLIGIGLLLCFLGTPSPVQATPIEESEAAITELQERMLQLNDSIATSKVKQEEQESAIEVLTQKEKKQAEEVKKATDKLEQLEKEVQERLKAIQLKETDQKAGVFQLENWTETLKALYSAETMRKADETRGKEYEEHVKTVEQKSKELKQQRKQVTKAKQDLTESLAQQEQLKIELEEEVAENQVELDRLRTEEQQQAALHQAEQEALLEELTQITLHDAEPAGEQSEEVQTIAQKIILSTKEYIGVPYVWGGTTPSGFDCSGLMQYVFAKHGISLPRVSQAQQPFAKAIALTELRPGDLVFWGQPAYHVGLYIGEGYFIHAPQPGDVVKVTHVSWFPYQSAGRVLE